VTRNTSAAQVTQPTGAAELALWATKSSLLPCEVADAAAAEELRALGLPLSTDPTGSPMRPPFSAPFSGIVPFLARLFRRCARKRGA
jgi:hypothetical protein